MLIETYMIFTVLAWVLLLTGYVFKAKATRIVMQILSLILFTSLALASADIETVSCIDGSINESSTDYYSINMSCNTYHHYDAGPIWINAGMATIAGVLTLITAFSTMEEGVGDE